MGPGEVVASDLCVGGIFSERLLHISFSYVGFIGERHSTASAVLALSMVHGGIV